MFFAAISALFCRHFRAKMKRFLQLEDVFGRYGRLRKVWVARRPPGFAFIEFEDQRDAEDSVKALDGT